MLDLVLTKTVIINSDFTPAMRLIADRMKSSVLQNLESGGRPTFNRLRSGRIPNLYPYLGNSIKSESGSDFAKVSTNKPGAFLHQYGGTFTVSDKQRRFFLAKYIETKSTMWLAMRASETLTWNPLPYMMFQEEDEEFISQTLLNHMVQQGDASGNGNQNGN